MKINIKTYEFEDIPFEWGMTFNEVTKILEGKKKFKPYGGWPNERYKCNSIFGVKANEFEIRAPLKDRPILQIQYELSPIETRFYHKTHVPYIKKLKKELGNPDSASFSYPKDKENQINNSDKVVYSAKWIIGDIRISLSVYGGIRKKDSGIARAGLFINWTNEILAAKPYREKNLKLEEKLEQNLSAKKLIDKFTLEYKQNPFSVTHYEQPDPFIARKDTNLRVHQMALYNKELIKTPNLLNQQLSNKQVIFYHINDIDLWFISNKWDTISLRKKEKENIIFSNVPSESKYGNKELGIKGLILKDAKESGELPKLVSKIESEIGINIQKIEITY